MRFRVRRLLSVSALTLLFGLHLPGCSSQQQSEDGLEVTEQGQGSEEGAEGENAQGEEGEQTNQGEEAQGQEEGQQGENVEQNAEGENSAEAEGNATENDLQEIIQEMNGQQTADTGEGETAPLQQNATTATDPAAMAANTGAMPAATTPTASTEPSASPMPFQPGGSPAAPGLPEVGSKMAYIVEAGDTLGKISQKIYGTPGRWNELATLSGLSNPSRIYPGDLVYYTLDESAVSFATAYESVQRGTESVQQGDTLATIAQRIYGSSKAWRSLWRHNDNIDNPDILTAGQAVYYVPKGSATAAVNTIKTNIAKVFKATLETSKKVSKSAVNKAKLMKISQVTTKLNGYSFASISNVFSSGLVAAI